MWWRAVVLVALLAAAWYVVHLIRDNAQQHAAIKSLTKAVNNLHERESRIEAAMVANDAADSEDRAQANRGVGKIQSARRTDETVIAIDKPWPAAMRGRVFDNPDPASGSTEAASPAGARVRGEPVREP